MVDRGTYRTSSACYQSEPDCGWQVYYQALGHFEQADWSRALVLLAEAEMTFRTCEDYGGLWRALIGQALVHWREGAAAQAIARAMAALRMASMANDGFAVGCIAWQLATMVLKQGDHRKAADYLVQAQTALDLIGMAPPGGILATAAQLCVEIRRWQQACEHGQIGRREAQAAIAEAQQELIDRLEQAAMIVRAAHRGAARADESEIAFLMLDRPLPPALPDPAAPRLAFGARLVRWWQQLLDGDDTASGEELVQAAITVLPPTGSPEADALDKPPDLDRPVDRKSVDTPAAEPEDTANAAENEPHSSAALARDHALRMPRSGLAIYCFGNFRVYIDDMLIERWESARSRAIFKYLVAHRTTTAPKELLADLFWPGSEPELARRSLHQAIYCLRQTFKRTVPDVQLIQFINDRYQISPEIAIWIDSEAFRQAIEQARALLAADEVAEAMRVYAVAVDLYSGEFLPEERYESWAEEPRRIYQAMYLETLHHLARYHHRNGDHQSAIMLGQRALAEESCDEEAHWLLMTCYMAQGLRHLAVRQYQLCVNALKTELGLSPSAELEAFYRRVVMTNSNSSAPNLR